MLNCVRKYLQTLGYEMKQNMGSFDKIARLAVAVIFFALFLTNVITGVFGYVLIAMGLIFSLTAFLNFCPLYSIFGISTCKIEE